MKLPVELKHTEHKHGGKIERIYSVGHECGKPRDGRSTDTWWFIGDVVWSDGGASREVEIAPFLLCGRGHDGQAEVNALCELMNDYLLKHGKWYTGKKSEFGIEGWYANVRPKVRRRA